MSNFFKNNAIETIRLIILVGGFVWGVSVMNSGIERNSEWNERQDDILKKNSTIYVRKDVSEVRYQAIMKELKTINKKLDD